MTMTPVELLRGAATIIEEHPEEHDQAEWGQTTECGTTFCAGGWIALLSGAEYDGRAWTVDGRDISVARYLMEVLDSPFDSRRELTLWNLFMSIEMDAEETVARLRDVADEIEKGEL